MANDGSWKWSKEIKRHNRFFPRGVVVDRSGQIYVAAWVNDRVMR